MGDNEEQIIDTLDTKSCVRCGAKAQYTLQIYEGEPTREAIAEEDCSLCLFCRIGLHLWLESFVKSE